MLRLMSIEKLPIRCVGLIAGMLTTTVAAMPGGFESTVETPQGLERTQDENKSSSRRARLDFSALRLASQDVSDRLTRSVTLPLPEGGQTVFVLRDSGVLPPQLAERFPDIRSMKGTDDYGRQIRLDMSAKGVRAVVTDSAGTWRMRPADSSGTSTAAKGDYIVFRDRAAPGVSVRRDPLWKGISAGPLFEGHAYREYRLAIATTSAFTKHHGGTVNDGMASVVETVNRANAVFERDVGVHLTLANDNDKIIFVDPASDPYIPASGGARFNYERDQNVRVTNEMIGAENYDIGHLFELDEAGGAIAALCQNKGKADASTGTLPAPGDPPGLTEGFIVTVIHELGHQLGADHTHNGCARDPGAAAAFEPGSGSTLMGYAGDCYQDDGKWPPEIDSRHNLQDIRDTYFHAKSIEQIREYVNGPAAACGIKREHPQAPPVVANPQGNVSSFIPARTPFVLEGYATSPNPDAQLTYVWEQVDPGMEQAEGEDLSDNGSGSIFRSYPPTSVGVRIFPRLEVVLGEEAIGKEEVFPATTRELNFRLTVRDNLPTYASTSFADRKIQVVDTGQAFSVTQPAGGTTWKGKGKRLVTWNVASTAQAPIACRTVRIDLSADGGHTYLSQPLVVSAPNTGRAWVDTPQMDRNLSTARVRVSCNNHLFFAVSQGNFTMLK